MLPRLKFPTSSRVRAPNKRMQRDATAVSIVRSGRRVSSFAECQQLAGGAPLMRMPLGGRRPKNDKEKMKTGSNNDHETSTQARNA